MMPDVDIFQTTLDHMRSGEGYYQAMGTVLRSHEFATASIFNWRPPLLYAVLALFPSVPIWALFAEVWAGLALAGAVLLRKWIWPMAICTLLAVCVRELALPFLAIVLFVDWRDRSRRRTWLAVIAIASGYYGWHWTMVIAQQTPADLQGPPWLFNGGWRFLLQTFTIPAGLLWPVYGPWIWAIVLTAIVCSARVPRLLRLTIGTYALLFVLVGRADPAGIYQVGQAWTGNGYWGWLVAPVQAVAVGLWLKPTVKKVLL